VVQRWRQRWLRRLHRQLQGVAAAVILRRCSKLLCRQQQDTRCGERLGSTSTWRVFRGLLGDSWAKTGLPNGPWVF
jgi:hypothetical protein